MYMHVCIPCTDTFTCDRKSFSETDYYMGLHLV